jgi:hypothetical protein
MIARSLYRARQFSNVLRGGLSAQEQEIVREFLSPEQLTLFWQTQPLARRHHVDVALDLLGGGWTSPDLIAAALLHDVGKGQLGVWPRVAVVLAQGFSPALFTALAQRGGPPPVTWLRIHAQHAEMGAAQVAAAGATKRMIELIRRHESIVPGDPEQAALRAADDRH